MHASMYAPMDSCKHAYVHTCSVYTALYAYTDVYHLICVQFHELQRIGVWVSAFRTVACEQDHDDPGGLACTISAGSNPKCHVVICAPGDDSCKDFPCATSRVSKRSSVMNKHPAFFETWKCRLVELLFVAYIWVCLLQDEQKF